MRGAARYLDTMIRVRSFFACYSVSIQATLYKDNSRTYPGDCHLFGCNDKCGSASLDSQSRRLVGSQEASAAEDFG